MSLQRSMIVGAHFRPPAKGLLAVLPAGSKLLARREPGNTYDANALMVIWPTTAINAAVGMGITSEMMQKAVEGFGSSADEIFSAPEWHLGYIPRTEASWLAPRLDEMGIAQIAGKLTFAATGGAQIMFEVPDNAI